VNITHKKRKKEENEK
jgi:hypothetical protein